MSDGKNNIDVSIRKIFEDTETHETSLFFLKLSEWMKKLFTDLKGPKYGFEEFSDKEEFERSGWRKCSFSKPDADFSNIGYVLFDNDKKEISFLTEKEAHDIQKKNNRQYEGKGYCEFSSSFNKDSLEKRIVSGENKVNNDGVNPALEFFAIRGNELESIKQIHAEGGCLSYTPPANPRSGPSLKM